MNWRLTWAVKWWGETSGSYGFCYRVTIIILFSFRPVIASLVSFFQLFLKGFCTFPHVLGRHLSILLFKLCSCTVFECSFIFIFVKDSFTYACGCTKYQEDYVIYGILFSITTKLVMSVAVWRHQITMLFQHPWDLLSSKNGVPIDIETPLVYLLWKHVPLPSS